MMNRQDWADLSQEAGDGLAKDLPHWRRARRRAYWLLLMGLLKAADSWPVGTGRGACVQLARLGLKIRPRDRERALANLQLAFPKMTPAEREILLRDSADALGMNLFDSLAAGRLMAAGEVTEEGAGETFAQVVARLADKGRGVFILTGHVGCWELLGAWIADQVRTAGLGKFGVITGTLHNEPIDQLVQSRRGQLGMKVLPRQEGVRPLLIHLRNGGVAGVLLDQNTDVRNLTVPFFGQQAPTPAGLAQLALKYGIPVLPTALARTELGHQVRWLAPLEPEPSAGAADENELRAFLTRCNEQLETLIRRNPAEWVWFHKRWECS